jgi:hypothetical protein
MRMTEPRPRSTKKPSAGGPDEGSKLCLRLGRSVRYFGQSTGSAISYTSDAARREDRLL